MTIQEGWNLFCQQVLATDGLQWAATVLGVAEVLLAKSNKIALYPTGIAGILLSVYILWQAGLYAESLLNGYYLVMSIYGWYHWVKRKNHPQVNVSYCTTREWGTTLTIVIAGFLVLYYLLHYYTPSTVPAWDAWVSATAWAGMWLLARRKIENWILLNISNLFAIPLLVYKQLPLFAALTGFLFIVALFGYAGWRKIILEQKTPA